MDTDPEITVVVNWRYKMKGDLMVIHQMCPYEASHQPLSHVSVLLLLLCKLCYCLVEEWDNVGSMFVSRL